MVGKLFSFLGNLSRHLNAWVVVGWFWLANLLSFAVMIGFRAIKTSGIAQTFEFDDVPMLHQLDLHYPWLVGGALISAGVIGAFLLTSYFSARNEPRTTPIPLLLQLGLMWSLGLFACRFVQPVSGSGVEIEAVGILDWLTLLFACSSAWSMLSWMTQETHRPELPEIFCRPLPEHRAVRLSLIYLLSCA
ncbi:MAG: hypothetical protein KDA84_30580, partial [Planctomycetaceae bacterium]|nr:hypothetical protein [Planctomycetaceae bacterium]